MAVKWETIAVIGVIGLSGYFLYKTGILKTTSEIAGATGGLISSAGGVIVPAEDFLKGVFDRLTQLENMAFHPQQTIYDIYNQTFPYRGQGTPLVAPDYSINLTPQTPFGFLQPIANQLLNNKLPDSLIPSTEHIAYNISPSNPWGFLAPIANTAILSNPNWNNTLGVWTNNAGVSTNSSNTGRILSTGVANRNSNPATEPMNILKTLPATSPTPPNTNPKVQTSIITTARNIIVKGVNPAPTKGLTPQGNALITFLKRGVNR